MANVFTEILPRIVARTLPVLRQYSIMPRVVSRQMEFTQGIAGDTIHVPMTNPVTVSDVVPGDQPTAPITNLVPSSVPVTVDQWKECSFGLTDKDITEIGNTADYLPRQVEEAIKALANTVDSYILGKLAAGVPYSVGTPGTTPFATDLTAYTNARAALARQLAPRSPRFVALDIDAEANALNLRAVQDASWRNSDEVMRTGSLGNIMGANWFTSENIVSRTDGTAAAYQLSAAVLAGSRSFPVDTGTGTLVAGDVFTVAGDTQPYAVEAFAGGIITVSPAARVNLADNAALTHLTTTGVLNWALHPDVFAFASRPIESQAGLGSIFQSVADPISGLAFRLEVSRQHRQVKWAFDALYGGKVVRPELGVRIYG